MTPWTGRALPGNRWDLLDGVVPEDPPAVSVIVAHYRQPEQLARTLAALERQDHPRDRLEVIVADDGSPTPPIVPPWVTLVGQTDEGFRLAAARNLGAAAARGDVLVFLDADTSPEPSFVRELTRLPALAPDCITVGRRRHADFAGVPLTADLVEAALARQLPEPAWLAEAYRRSRDLLHADDRSYRFVIGAVLACSRRMFEVAGGFDESFTSYGGEDWEWAYRAWIRGAVLAHVASAVAWHDGPDAAGRATARAVKNAEAIRLADLIPLPGSAGRGLRSERVDVAVTGVGGSPTPGQAFVSADSLLAALPGARWVPRLEDLGSGRYDRVRLLVEILRPARATSTAFAEQVARVGEEALGELVLRDGSGRDCVRVSSPRARARAAHWGRDDLFPREVVVCDALSSIPEDVDVEGYLGGWA